MVHINDEAIDHYEYLFFWSVINKTYSNEFDGFTIVKV